MFFIYLSIKEYLIVTLKTLKSIMIINKQIFNQFLKIFGVENQFDTSLVFNMIFKVKNSPDTQIFSL